MKSNHTDSFPVIKGGQDRTDHEVENSAVILSIAIGLVLAIFSGLWLVCKFLPDFTR